MNSFADLIRVRNIHTGQIGRIARHLFENPRINNGILVEVDDSAKPYLEGFYKTRFPVTTPDPEPEAEPVIFDYPSEEES